MTMLKMTHPLMKKLILEELAKIPPGEGIDNNSQDTVLVKNSPSEVDIRTTKLELTTSLIFLPDNTKVYVKDELRDGASGAMDRVLLAL
jgi:hypothetical protein